MKNSISVIHALRDFVDQKPNFCSFNYDSLSSLNADRRKVNQQKKDFYYLIYAFNAIYSNPLTSISEYIEKELRNSKGRLSINEKDEITYVVGQYFPTEYRSSVCYFLGRLLWNYVQSSSNQTKSIKEIAQFFRQNIKQKSILKYIV